MKNIAVLLTIGLLLSCSHNKQTNMKSQLFKFYTQYNQFYVADKGATGDTGSPNFWSEEAFNRRLAIENGIIGVSTESYGNIKGEIEVLEKSNPNIDYSKFDHIVEGGIDIQSEDLQILNSPDSNLELVVKVNPGKYRVRIYSSNLASVKENDEPHETDNDYYRIELWKSDDMEPKVLKQYNH